MIHTIGTRYRIDGNTYLLSQIEPNKVCMIQLSTGNRLSDPIFIDNIRLITNKDIKEMIGVENIKKVYIRIKLD